MPRFYPRDGRDAPRRMPFSPLRRRQRRTTLDRMDITADTPLDDFDDTGGIDDFA